MLSDELDMIGKNSKQTWAIIADKTVWKEDVNNGMKHSPKLNI